MQREEFSKKVKNKIIRDLGEYCCKCQEHTRDGECAHIISLQKGGPRSYTNYSELIDMEDEIRKLVLDSHENGLYLCSNCHSEVDKHEDNYPHDVLKKMRKDAVKRNETNKKLPFLEYRDEFNGKIVDIMYAKFIEVIINVNITKKLDEKDGKTISYLMQEIRHYSFDYLPRLPHFESGKLSIIVNDIVKHLGTINQHSYFKLDDLEDILASIYYMITVINHPKKNILLQMTLYQAIVIMLSHAMKDLEFDDFPAIFKYLPRMISKTNNSYLKMISHEIRELKPNKLSNFKSQDFNKLKSYIETELEIGTILRDNGNPMEKIQKAKAEGIFPAHYTHFYLSDFDALKDTDESSDDEIDTITPISQSTNSEDN